MEEADLIRHRKEMVARVHLDTCTPCPNSSAFFVRALNAGEGSKGKAF